MHESFQEEEKQAKLDLKIDLENDEQLSKVITQHITEITSKSFKNKTNIFNQRVPVAARHSSNRSNQKILQAGIPMIPEKKAKAGKLNAVESESKFYKTNLRKGTDSKNENMDMIKSMVMSFNEEKNHLNQLEQKDDPKFVHSQSQSRLSQEQLAKSVIKEGKTSKNIAEKVENQKAFTGKNSMVCFSRSSSFSRKRKQSRDYGTSIFKQSKLKDCYGAPLGNQSGFSMNNKGPLDENKLYLQKMNEKSHRQSTSAQKRAKFNRVTNRIMTKEDILTLPDIIK